MIAGAGTLLLMVAIIGGVWLWIMKGDNGKPAGAERLQARVVVGRAALLRGDFAKANAELRAARAELSRNTALVPPEEAQRIVHLHRQAECLAHLSDRTLEELLAEADRPAPGTDWDHYFAQQHRGRTIAFEARARIQRHEGQAVVAVDYPLAGPSLPARLEFQDGELPEQLAGDSARRLIFGAALASVTLVRSTERPNGEWVIRFQPSSFVLLDEPGLAAALGVPAADLPNGTPDLRSRFAATLKRFDAPDRVARQILATRIVECWIYDKTPDFWLSWTLPRGSRN